MIAPTDLGRGVWLVAGGMTLGLVGLCGLLRGPADAMVLVVANPGQAGTTVNLMAPIVVNTATGASAQVILEGQDWPLRAELAPLAG